MLTHNSHIFVARKNVNIIKSVIFLCYVTILGVTIMSGDSIFNLFLIIY